MQFELPLTLKSLSEDPLTSESIANHVRRLERYRKACRVLQFIGSIAVPIVFAIFVTSFVNVVKFAAVGTVLLSLVLIVVTTAIDASLVLALQRYRPISEDKRAEIVQWTSDDCITRYLDRVGALPREITNHEFTLLRFKWSIRNCMQRTMVAAPERQTSDALFFGGK